MARLLNYCSVSRIRANNTVGSWLWIGFILQYLSGLFWWPLLSPGYKDLLSTFLHSVLPLEIYVLVTAHVLRAVLIGGLAGNVIWSGTYLILSVFFVSTSGYISVSGEAGAWAYNLFFSIFSSVSCGVFTPLFKNTPFIENLGMEFFSSLSGGATVNENLMDLVGITPHVLIAFALMAFLFLHLLSTHENHTSAVGEDSRFVGKSQLRNSAEAFDILLIIGLVSYTLFCMVRVLIDLRLGNNAAFVGFTVKPPVRIVTDIALSGFYFLVRVFPLGGLIICIAAFLFAFTIFSNWSMLGRFERIAIIGVILSGIVYIVLCCIVFPLCSRIFLTACLFSEGLCTLFLDFLLPALQQKSFAEDKSSKIIARPKCLVFVPFGLEAASAAGDLALADYYAAFGRELNRLSSVMLHSSPTSESGGVYWRVRCGFTKEQPISRQLHAETYARVLGDEFKTLAQYLSGFPFDSSFRSMVSSASYPCPDPARLEERFHNYVRAFFNAYSSRLSQACPRDRYWLVCADDLLRLEYSLRRRPVTLAPAILDKPTVVSEPTFSIAEIFSL